MSTKAGNKGKQFFKDQLFLFIQNTEDVSKCSFVDFCAFTDVSRKQMRTAKGEYMQVIKELAKTVEDGQSKKQFQMHLKNAEESELDEIWNSLQITRTCQTLKRKREDMLEKYQENLEAASFEEKSLNQKLLHENVMENIRFSFKKPKPLEGNEIVYNFAVSQEEKENPADPHVNILNKNIPDELDIDLENRFEELQHRIKNEKFTCSDECIQIIRLLQDQKNQDNLWIKASVFIAKHLNVIDLCPIPVPTHPNGETESTVALVADMAKIKEELFEANKYRDSLDKDHANYAKLTIPKYDGSIQNFEDVFVDKSIHPKVRKLAHASYMLYQRKKQVGQLGEKSAEPISFVPYIEAVLNGEDFECDYGEMGCFSTSELKETSTADKCDAVSRTLANEYMYFEGSGLKPSKKKIILDYCTLLYRGVCAIKRLFSRRVDVSAIKIVLIQQIFTKLYVRELCYISGRYILRSISVFDYEKRNEARKVHITFVWIYKTVNGTHNIMHAVPDTEEEDLDLFRSPVRKHGSAICSPSTLAVHEMAKPKQQRDFRDRSITPTPKIHRK